MRVKVGGRWFCGDHGAVGVDLSEAEVAELLAPECRAGLRLAGGGNGVRYGDSREMGATCLATWLSEEVLGEDECVHAAAWALFEYMSTCYDVFNRHSRGRYKDVTWITPDGWEFKRCNRWEGETHYALRGPLLIGVRADQLRAYGGIAVGVEVLVGGGRIKLPPEFSTDGIQRYPTVDGDGRLVYVTRLVDRMGLGPHLESMRNSARQAKENLLRAVAAVDSLHVGEAESVEEAEQRLVWETLRSYEGNPNPGVEKLAQGRGGLSGWLNRNVVGPLRDGRARRD